MFVVSAVAALAALALGAVAIRSLQRFVFLALLAVLPVASLSAVVPLGSRADDRWLTRSTLAVLLVMIAWRRWSGVLVWPIFFALFWLLNLLMSAVAYGAQTLRHPGGSHASVGTIAEVMLDFVRSVWGDLLGTSWQNFWLAAVIAALAVAGRFVWRRTRQVGTSPDAGLPQGVTSGERRR